MVQRRRQACARRRAAGADDEVGAFARGPEAREIGRVVLAVGIHEEEPAGRGGRGPERLAQRGRLAVVRPAVGEHRRAGLPRQQRGGVAAAVVDHGHERETGRAAAPHDRSDGGGLVAGGDENVRCFFHAGYSEEH
ncbi:MAG: hypothetical protein WDO13_05360 [Verrucomicrobiota bacterium]